MDIDKTCLENFSFIYTYIDLHRCMLRAYAYYRNVSNALWAEGEFYGLLDKCIFFEHAPLF